MKTYPKQSKSSRSDGEHYFGDYGDISMGISLSSVNQIGDIQDKMHLHQKGTEFYIILEGKGVLEVEGKNVELKENEVVMVEPGEKHRVKEATEAPFKFLVICDVKEKEDKIILE